MKNPQEKSQSNSWPYNETNQPLAETNPKTTTEKVDELDLPGKADEEKLNPGSPNNIPSETTPEEYKTSNSVSND